MHNKQKVKTGESSTEDERRDNAREIRTRRGKKRKKRERKNVKRIEPKKLAWIDTQKELVRIKKELKRAEKQWNRTKRDRRRERITQTEKAKRGRLIHKIRVQAQQMTNRQGRERQRRDARR